MYQGPRWTCYINPLLGQMLEMEGLLAQQFDEAGKRISRQV